MRMHLEMDIETDKTAEEIRDLLMDPKNTLTIGAADLVVSDSSTHMRVPDWSDRQMQETRERIDGFMTELAFTDWEQRDVLRDFVMQQSQTSSPGIIDRLEHYVRTNYSNGEEVGDNG